MSKPLDFLHGVAQALSTLALYPSGHASRGRTLENLHGALQDLLEENDNPVFSFLDGAVIYGPAGPLREMGDWEWSHKLADVGVQRLEFRRDAPIGVADLEEVLDDIIRRIQHREAASDREQRETGIKYGAVATGDAQPAPEPSAPVAFSLREEAETVQWVHGEIRAGRPLPLNEAEAVVRGLAVAMHGGHQMMLPMLASRSHDDYATTHAINVCVLTMGLAEFLGLGAREVRAFGLAGLLHDVGTLRVPSEILNKTGTLTDQERDVVQRHPADGARIILAAGSGLDMASIVAYEHHVTIDGGGYPNFRFPRECHFSSRLVHVCDVSDALGTTRPFRPAWPMGKVLAYLEERSGTEFDGPLAHAFTNMMRTWEPHLTAFENGAAA